MKRSLLTTVLLLSCVFFVALIKCVAQGVYAENLAVDGPVTFEGDYALANTLRLPHVGDTVEWTTSQSLTLPISITQSGFSPTVATVTMGMPVVWINYLQETVHLLSGEPYHIYLPLVLRKTEGLESRAIGSTGTVTPSPLTAVPAAPHQDSWVDVDIGPGESYTHTFTAIGDYPYYLSSVLSVIGRVVVVPIPLHLDTDHDGLSDYEEVAKYSTDPRRADTDGDGFPDGDWNERREYVYTVRILIKIRQPFDAQTMNDWYQDVRTLGDPDPDGYTQVEAIIYPDTVVDVYPSSYPLDDPPPELQRYTLPGIAANYTPNMQSEVLQILEGSETDVDAANRVSQWISEETTFYLDQSVPEVYYTYLENGEVKVRNYGGPLPVEELLQTHYFADSMFQMRTHGSCTSIANLRCAMLKAAGIPCRVIQTIFPIYYHGDQTVPYVNNLKREWSCVFEQPSGQGASWCNHAFVEVYVGDRWIRADRTINVRHEDPLCLSLKILSVSDWSEVDFSETWPVDWIHNRPFYTLLLEDQEPQH
jgi:transglutaminase-like putative cysteine protease